MRIRIILTLAILSLFASISLYAYKFGFELSNEHSTWAEFGNFFGGVLGPIFAFCSLIYLAFQVEMQWKESKAARIASEINNRESYISTNLLILIPKLTAIDPSIQAPISELILQIHMGKNLEDTNLELLKIGLSARAETLVVWVNIAAALSYLKVVDKNRYLNQLTLVTVQVGRELCTALDRVTKLATEINFDHHFN